MALSVAWGTLMAEKLLRLFWAVERTLQGWALHWLTWEQGGEALGERF